MAKYKYLSKDERITIEQMLHEGVSFKQIGLRLKRNKSTISREVLKNSEPKQTGCHGSPFNNCIHRKTCNQYKLCKKEDCRRQTCTGCKFCFRLCPDFCAEYCDKLERPPYTCNGCRLRMKCTLEKFLYTGHKAHLISTQMAKQSREGIAVSPAEITRLNQVISPLVKQGQSIHNIFMTHKDEIMADESTIYRYIKLGLFDAKVTDLLNVVKMKPRRVKPKLKVDKAYIKGREYRSFLKFIQDNPDMPIVQMDTVEGQKGHGEPVLLTMHFVEAELMLAFKREANTAQSVTDIVDKLYKRLGHDTFTNLFQVILCDQGSEFSNPCAIENTLKGTSRTRIFYTEPSAPYQKGACENNHSLIRRIIPKGTSLRGYSPKNITLMMNHINSYKRKKLKAKSPIETFNFFHDPLILKKLGVTLVKPDDVILNPSLFK